MKKINQENIYDYLDEVAPEFRNYKDYTMWYHENPSLHIGNFATFIIVEIEERKEGIKKIFSFINESINNEMIEEDFKNIFIGQIFETLAESKQAIKITQKLLNGEALKIFNLQVE